MPQLSRTFLVQPQLLGQFWWLTGNLSPKSAGGEHPSRVLKSSTSSGGKKGPAPQQPKKAVEKVADPFDPDLDLTSPIPPGGFKRFRKPLNKSAVDLKAMGMKGVELAANLDKAGTVTPEAFEGFMIAFQHLALTRGNGQVLTTRSLNGQILIVVRDIAAVPVVTGWVQEIKWTDSNGIVHGFRRACLVSSWDPRRLRATTIGSSYQLTRSPSE